MIAARRPAERLHLSEGPIELVIKADGGSEAVELACLAARRRFDGLLGELVAELQLLRKALADEMPPLRGPIARRMTEAAWPHRAAFVTPMVAVAGAVAEAVLAAMVAAAPLRRAFVNNGGDIAVHLAEAEHIDIGIVRSLQHSKPEAFVRIDAQGKVRGIATSGRHGRSLSLGIADAVTVLAQTAAAADAAATMIANAVDVADPAVIRRPARQLDPDSDLLDLPVTVAVGPLSEASIHAALAAGRNHAETLVASGLIEGALISLADRWENIGVDDRYVNRISA